MSEVFLAQKGQLTDPSKSALRKAGIVVVEVEDPSKCKFIRSTETVSENAMMMAAFEAVCFRGGTYSTGSDQRERLANNLLRIMFKDFPEVAASLRRDPKPKP